ncbi:MAG: S1 RNA-binding domain-containing protein [Candidatus Eremiobacteraeota bacterium]|nr:S1 RNA-binding domain-containing protein [Candidatus Eremiobacteraeota bacterium]
MEAPAPVEAPASVEAPAPGEAPAPVEVSAPESAAVVVATPEAVVAAPVAAPVPPATPDPEAIERAKAAAAARAAADAARRAQAEEAWKALAAGKITREIVEATLKSAVKGGYLVGIGAFRGFLPASQSRLAGIAPEQLAGTKIPTIVLDADDAKKRVVVSHRQALEVQRRGARAELLANLKVGAEREATVVRLADFGAFVDLGGVDALVPIGELALERVEKVADVVKVGDKFAVKVLRVDEGGKKIGVSRRAMLPDPWRDHAALLQRGKVVEGTVIENGAELKIELAPGIVGTISENEAIPSDYEIGEKVEVTVRSLDPRTRRLRLSTMHATPSFESGSFAPLGHELKG